MDFLRTEKYYMVWHGNENVSYEWKGKKQSCIYETGCIVSLLGILYTKANEHDFIHLNVEKEKRRYMLDI